MNTSLIDLIHKNINMKHISCFLGEFAQGERHGAIEKPRARCGLALFDGAIEFTFDGKKTLYSSGSVLFLPTGSRYSYKVLDETLRVYSVNFELFGEKDESVVPFDTPTLLGNEGDLGIREQFARCVTLFRTSTNRIALKSEAFSLLSSVILLFSREKVPENIRLAVDTIRNNIHDELRISELAAACGMSESTFRREFHRYALISPKQYILDRKISKAKQMLRSGDYPIKEICLILGFYDDAYFSKLFKKATGLTPMQYAQEKGTL